MDINYKEEDMIEIKITVEYEGTKAISIEDVPKKQFRKIEKICKDYKTDVTSLLINDISELTAEEAEAKITAYDMPIK